MHFLTEMFTLNRHSIKSDNFNFKMILKIVPTQADGGVYTTTTATVVDNIAGITVGAI